MNFPMNAPHERYYPDPDRRPSNEVTDPLLEHTRWRVANMARWLDEQNVVREAELVTEAACSKVRPGDPGE